MNSTRRQDARHPRLIVVAATAGVLSIAGAPVALAQTLSNYSGTGDTTTSTGVFSGSTSRGGTGSTARTAGTASNAGTVRTGVRSVSRSSSPSSLPFTGGEVVLIAVAGAAAVAAGAGMVVGGRRRSVTLH